MADDGGGRRAGIVRLFTPTRHTGTQFDLALAKITRR
jgi:hypothetical protein